jgi:hypothetical protein
MSRPWPSKLLYWILRIEFLLRSRYCEFTCSIVLNNAKCQPITDRLVPCKRIVMSGLSNAWHIPPILINSTTGHFSQTILFYLIPSQSFFKILFSKAACQYKSNNTNKLSNINKNSENLLDYMVKIKVICNLMITRDVFFLSNFSIN